ALEEIEGKKGETYIPLGSSNFVLGKVEDSENILVSIGSGLAIKKKRAEALEITNQRIKELQTEGTKINKELNRIGSELMKLQAEIEEMRQ
ncbi:MAG: prefoldin subunit alpha, partial [Candidatus Aenigmarchaeota archaeon]|nr:prefoldin subunit alpha [Candidatus Aenigmarchaeota archaeon]